MRAHFIHTWLLCLWLGPVALLVGCAEGATLEVEGGAFTGTPEGKLPDRFDAGSSPVQDTGAAPPPPETRDSGFVQPDPVPPDQGTPPDQGGAPPPDGSDPPEPEDNDGDGFDVRSDCDDNNPSVYFGAPESCNDNVDNDCNGHINEGCNPPRQGEVGSSCTFDTECGTGGQCLWGWSDNYCTTNCDNGVCPGGAQCYNYVTFLGTVNVCLRSCRSRADCRLDQGCAFGDNGEGYCVGACYNDGDCSSSEVCDLGTNLCTPE